MAERVQYENYLHIAGWMTKLGLKNLNEVAAFALVYGFSQDGESIFKGSISYIQEWLMCSRHTAINTMRRLEEKGFVSKEQSTTNGITLNYYKVNCKGSAKIAPLVQILQGGSAKIAPGSAKIAPNNNIDNNIDNNILLLEEAHAHTHEENGLDLILGWVCDNEEGLQQMLFRNKLITTRVPMLDMIEIIKPYVEEYYTGQLMSGGEDIIRRGRRDIKQHFSQWLPKYIKKVELEEQQKQQDYEQSIDPVSRAMQDLVKGMQYASATKEGW